MCWVQALGESEVIRTESLLAIPRVTGVPGLDGLDIGVAVILSKERTVTDRFLCGGAFEDNSLAEFAGAATCVTPVLVKLASACSRVKVAETTRVMARKRVLDRGIQRVRD